MQIPKKHFPVVGLIGIVLVAAAGGSIFYYQFVLSPSAKCTVAPVHRLIFLTAIIHERGGFTVTNGAILNQQALPKFSNITGPNLANTTYTNYKTSDNSTILGNEGDVVTLYIKSISTNVTGPPPLQKPTATGHGFTIDTDVGVVNGTIANDNIVFGTWHTVTIQLPTSLVTSTFHCTQDCSAEHPMMRGGFTVGCG